MAFTAGAISVDESGTATHTYTFSIDDPGADTVDSIAVSCGDNGTVDSQSFDDDSGTFDCIFPDGDATSTVTAQATDSDLEAGNTATREVAISNVAPTVTFDAGLPDSVDEGQATIAYSYTIFDPGADTVTAVDVSCGANGTVDSESFDDDSGTFTCVFPDGDATSTVSAQATDSDNDAGNTAELEVTIDNIAPEVAFTAGAISVDESGTATHTYTFSIDDPGADTVDSIAVSCGDNGTVDSQSFDDDSGTFDCIFPDGDATSTVTAQATDSDLEAGNTATREVAIANVAPDATAAANQSGVEGTPESFALGSFTDPGDDGPWSVSIDWGDGTTDQREAMEEPGDLGSFPHTYIDNGLYTVTVTVREFDPTPPDEIPGPQQPGDTASFMISIANAAPVVITPPEPQAGDEGSVSVQLGSFTDLGINDDPWTVTVDWGDGSTDTEFLTNAQGNLGAESHQYADNLPAEAPYTITVTVTDKDGASDSATMEYVVRNVAPTATLTHNGPVDEGSPIVLTLTDIIDPGTADTHTFSFDCGDGAGYSLFGTSNTRSCPTNDNGTRLVGYKIRDDDGGETGGTATIGIDNVKPKATFSNNGPVFEGSPLTLSLTDPEDPSTVDHAIGFDHSFDCGNPTTALETAYGGASQNTHDCTYADNGNYDVRGRIMDKDGGYTTESGIGQVLNANPVVTITSPADNSQFDTATPVTVVASVTDAGTADTHTCTVMWGDGAVTSGTVTQGSGSGPARQPTPTRRPEASRSP